MHLRTVSMFTTAADLREEMQVVTDCQLAVKVHCTINTAVMENHLLLWLPDFWIHFEVPSHNFDKLFKLTIKQSNRVSLKFSSNLLFVAPNVSFTDSNHLMHIVELL